MNRAFWDEIPGWEDFLCGPVHGYSKTSVTMYFENISDELYTLLTGMIPYRATSPVLGFEPGEIQRALDVYFGRIPDPKSSFWAQGELRSRYEGTPWATATPEQIIRDIQRWINFSGPAI